MESGRHTRSASLTQCWSSAIRCLGAIRRSASLGSQSSAADPLKQSLPPNAVIFVWFWRWQSVKLTISRKLCCTYCCCWCRGCCIVWGAAIPMKIGRVDSRL